MGDFSFLLNWEGLRGRFLSTSVAPSIQFFYATPSRQSIRSADTIWPIGFTSLS
ncbi:MAG: hypothetical protein RJA70_4949 [Pseudomonadota bacterium]|jgi:hypothetical protein